MARKKKLSREMVELAKRAFWEGWACSSEGFNNEVIIEEGATATRFLDGRFNTFIRRQGYDIEPEVRVEDAPGNS